MARLCKCHCCEITDKEEKVKHDGKNVHIKCMESYLRLLEQEEQRKELLKYLEELHSALFIPPRNQNRLKAIKQDKNIPYRMILEAYKQCEDKMKWFISEVLKDQNSAEDINKAITLMLNDGLNKAVKNDMAKQRREQRIREELTDTAVNTEKQNEITYKKKSSVKDISAFL